MLGALAAAPAPAQEAPGQVGRQVLAFYYTWYGSPQVSGRWEHWRRGDTDFADLDDRGLPRLEAKNHPSIGLYDSTDPLVIRAHLKLAARASIDGFIATWWGKSHFTDRAFARCLAAAEKLASPVKLTVYYETVPGRKPERAVDDLCYILARYGRSPSFLTVGVKPVIFLYGRALGQLPTDAWRGVIERVRARHPALFIVDTDAARAPPANVDGLHVYNPAARIKQGQDLAAFYRGHVARAKGKIACATVIPGYDDTVIRTPGMAVPRRGGDLYRRLWRQAELAAPDWILITSWNEWHEGSEIEPSVEDGMLYLRLTRELAARFKGAPRAPGRPAPKRSRS